MKTTLLPFFKLNAISAGISLTGLLVVVVPTQAELIPDGSVGTINDNGNIRGGTITTDGTQQNLFHSFREFSLSPTQTATFIAPDSVENIITRVTGRTPSAIDGTLQVANTTSNLFLINPAGIVFGSTAQLSVPGSFVATTAEQMMFKNGFTFDIESLNAPPLMTVSAPIGIQMGTGSITVNNTGHTLAKIDLTNPTLETRNFLMPHVQRGPTTGLQVIPGNTLALIGNGIAFNGGLVTANSGHVEIGSVATGSLVDLNPTGFVADYTQVDDFQSITFSNRSLANVSGVPAPLLSPLPFQLFTTHQGSLQVAGHDISLQDASLLLGQSGVAATQVSGDLLVRASGTLSLSGSEATSLLRSGIVSETLGPSSSGAINVEAAQIRIQNGAGILGFTFTESSSGDIGIQATEQLTISGFDPLYPLITSSIATASLVSTGRSGNITVTAPTLQLSESGNVASINFAQGQSGDLFINVDDISLTGRGAASDIPSSITASNFGPGIAGNIEIDTERLTIEDKALIAASSVSNGAAGSVRITANERIDIREPIASTRRISAINSAVFSPNSLERTLLNIPDTLIPAGDAGNVIIKTPILAMSGLASINVQNEGSGNGGEISVTANSAVFRNGSQIRALTMSGEGGDIDLQIRDSLIFRSGSGITVESEGTGNGGNITISSPVVIALENSDIVANAVRGRGGNINITSQSILGTAFRDRLTPESDITASSEFGLNGTVELETPTVDPVSGAISLPTTVLDPDQQVAVGCTDDTQGNHFIASGRGGLPQSPQDMLPSSQVWLDFRPTSSSLTSTGEWRSVAEPPSSNQIAAPISEAVHWNRNSKGEVQLVAGNQLSQTAIGCLEDAG